MSRRLLRHEVISRLVIAAMHEAIPHMSQRAIAAECHTSLRTVNQAVHQPLQYWVALLAIVPTRRREVPSPRPKPAEPASVDRELVL